MYSIEKKRLKAYLGTDLYNEFKKYNVIIGGGFITSLFTNSKINDIDVYFRTNEDLFNFADYNLEGRFILSHSTKATLFNIVEKDNSEKLVQLIHYRTFNNHEELFNSFDFTACMGAFDFKDEEFKLHEDFMKHNSQRLLRFNENTDYPLISAIRIHKYQEKGYTISKPEYFRIMMTCMTLDIKSYDELKEHIGGMYGVNYDELFEEVEDKEFSMHDAIKVLGEVYHSDEYFTKWKPVTATHEEIMMDLDKAIKTIIQFEGENFRYKGSNLNRIDLSRNTGINKEMTLEEFLQKHKLYKFVSRKNDDTLRSHHDSKFIYTIGEEAVAAKDGDGNLYFNYLNTIKNSPYSRSHTSVLIEVEVKAEDVLSITDSEIRAFRCKVIREVPKEEYDDGIKDIINNF